MDLPEIKSYLEEHEGPIYNVHGVEIDTNSQHIAVCAAIPGHQNRDEQMYIDCCCYCHSAEDFFKLFDIHTVGDLQTITPEGLQKLYEEGNAEISCIHQHSLIELSFRKQGNSIFASHEDGIHKVSAELVTPDDFIGYAKSFMQQLVLTKRK